jgi:hypothetical protein
MDESGAGSVELYGTAGIGMVSGPEIFLGAETARSQEDRMNPLAMGWILL